MGQILFTFQSPVSYNDTMQMIQWVINSINGEVKAVQAGYIKSKWVRAGFGAMRDKYEFYISNEDCPSIRVVSSATEYAASRGDLILKKDYIDLSWGRFVSALLTKYPHLDFALYAGEPYVDALIYSDNEVRQVFTSSTSHHPSYGKALIGGMLFGEAGAVIGGMGGRSNTHTQVMTQAAKTVYMKVRMSNGRIKEGNISVKSREYNQIMVNMRRM